MLLRPLLLLSFGELYTGRQLSTIYVEGQYILHDRALQSIQTQPQFLDIVRFYDKPFPALHDPDIYLNSKSN